MTVTPPATNVGTPKRRKFNQNVLEMYDATPKRENALMNRVVLQTIFGCLNGKDLRTFRLVHTCWNTEAIFHLKRRSDYINFGIHSNTRKVYEFMECIESSNDFPFTKLYIPYGMETVARNDLLASFAGRLTSLKIYVGIRTGSFSQQLEFPKLTELDFEENFYFQDTLNFIPDFLEKFSGRLTSIKVIRPRKRILRLLANLPQLRLRKLIIVQYESDHSEMVQAVIAKHKNSLEHLELSSHWYYSWLKPVHMPALQFLKVEDIGHFRTYEGNVIPFPSLNAFHISSTNDSTTDNQLIMLFGGKSAPTVKSVHLLESSSVTEAVANLFPNAERLMITAKQNNLLQIMEPLIRLTELEVCLEGFLNTNLMDLLIGHQYKWGSKKSLTQMNDEIGRKLEQPPYSSLHRIERIKLNFKQIHRSLSVQNLLLPCRLLFPQMQNLRQLTIQQSNKKNLSLSKRMQSVLDMLEQKVQIKWETP